MTSFEKVVELNTYFGNFKGDITNPNIGAIRTQSMLCLEEAIEMVEAAHPGQKVKINIEGESGDSVDIIGLKDAHGDLITVTEGVAHIVGFNGDSNYDLVHASNLTKLIANEEELEQTIQSYVDMGFSRDNLYSIGEFPFKCLKVKNAVTVKGKFYPTGKFLKNSLKFKEPTFH